MITFFFIIIYTIIPQKKPLLYSYFWYFYFYDYSLVFFK
jgi:hypothetical protein